MPISWVKLDWQTVAHPYIKVTPLWHIASHHHGSIMQDPGALKCRGRNDELWKRRLIVVDDRVLNIVKRVGLEGLYRTPCREIDHNLITAFVERWRPETHTFHLPHGETMITLQDGASFLFFIFILMTYTRIYILFIIQRSFRSVWFVMMYP